MADIRTSSSKYLNELDKALRGLDIRTLKAVADTLWTTYKQQQTIYVFGNGGSAASASHFVADLGKGTLGHKGDLPIKGFRALSLNDNMAALTAWANDSGYENAIAGQLERLINRDDVAIAISASGNSPNVLAAIEQAKYAGATTIGMSGFGGGRLSMMCHYSLVIDSYDYGIVEDAHMCIVHMITQHLRDCLFELVEGSTMIPVTDSE